MTHPTCPSCSGAFDVASFLSAVSGYSRSTNSGGAACPLCQASLEFRVGPDVLELGYTSWGGSMHFDGVNVFEVPGLRLLRDDEGWAAQLSEKTFPLPEPGP